MWLVFQVLVLNLQILVVNLQDIVEFSSGLYSVTIDTLDGGVLLLPLPPPNQPISVKSL